MVRKARELNRLWQKGDRAKVIKTLAPYGQLDVALLRALLDVNHDCVKSMAKLVAHAGA